MKHYNLILIFVMILILMMGVIAEDTQTTKKTSQNTQVSSEKIGQEEKNIKIGNLNEDAVKIKSLGGENSYVVVEKDGKTAVIQGDGDFSLKIMKKDGTGYNEYKGFSTEGLLGKPRFKLDENGNIIEASFKTSDNNKYIFRNHELEIPKASKFDLKDNKASIMMPDLTEIKTPKKVNPDLEEFSPMTFVFKGNNLKLPNNFKMNKGEISFKDEKFFLNPDQATTINNVGINAFGKGERANDRTDIYFDGEKHSGSYMSFGSDGNQKILIIESEQKSPHPFIFREGNDFVQDKGRLIILPQGASKIILTKNQELTLSFYGSSTYGTQHLVSGAGYSMFEIGIYSIFKRNDAIYISNTNLGNGITSPEMKVEFLDKYGIPEEYTIIDSDTGEDKGRSTFYMQWGKNNDFTIESQEKYKNDVIKMKERIKFKMIK